MYRWMWPFNGGHHDRNDAALGTGCGMRIPSMRHERQGTVHIL